MSAIEKIADNYSQSQMIGLGVAFIICPVLAVGLRIWAKVLGRRGVAYDDYLIIGAMACAIGCGSVQLVAAIDGQLGQHQTDDGKGMPILDDPRFVTYEKCKFAVNILSTVGLGLVKSSFLVLYMNIFFGKAFRIATQAMLLLVFSWTVSFFFANLFTCYPITPFIEAFYGNNCVDGLSMWYAMAITDIIIDFIILVMPIPMVLKLQLPLKQKLGVLGMFLLGALVCAFSITRALIYVHVGEKLQLHFNDETYYTSPVFFWATIELSSAVLSASLPTYRPIWLWLRGRPVNDPKVSVRLNSYPRDQSRHGRAKYGYDINGRDVDSRPDSSDDVATLTREPGVNTRVATGRPSKLDMKDGITVEQTVVQDSRQRDVV